MDVTLALAPDAPERFALEMEGAGFTLRVAEPDFVRRTAGRTKDLEDARALWHLHGTTLDGERIRRILGLLEQALDRSDLTPTFGSIARGAHPGR